MKTTHAKHVAIIMDGNGRWAKARGQARVQGHIAGVEAVRRSVKAAINEGIDVLTLFAFSSENWQRPKREVDFLMQLLGHTLKKESKELHAQGVRLSVIGDRQGLNLKLQQHIHQAETLTQENTKLHLVLAINYGGRWDITQAVRQIASRVASDDIPLDAIDEQLVEGFLATADLPPVDLLIRTSGEQRVSNFLLWQLAYSELYFCDEAWPDFDVNVLHQALMHFQHRDRRFGCVDEEHTKTADDERLVG